MSDPAPSLHRPVQSLTDGIVTLDAFTRSDVAALVEAIDDEILRWLPLPDPYGETDARQFVDAPANVAPSGDALNFAIRRSLPPSPVTDLRVAGSIGVAVSRPRTGEVELGYWVAAHARQHGTARRAVALLARHTLATPGVERLEILTHPANHRSRRVAERVGARYEGIRRNGLVPPARDGTTDAAVYALLPGEVRSEGAGALRERT